MNPVNVECEPVSYDQGNEETFINKLLDEMKSKFNKTEPNPCTETNSEVETKITQLESSHKEIHIENDIKDDVCETSNILMMFKKPSDESSGQTEDVSPGRRSSRQKRIPPDCVMEGAVKRSSRRGSRNHKESVLQSAIARKEKSYNESNKPQRLTRQLKPTPKILENIASAKDKSKVKTKNSDTDGQNNNVDLSYKKLKKIKNPKRSIKKLKVEHDDSDIETDSDESISDDNILTMEMIKSTRRSQRISSSQKKDEFDEISGASSNMMDQDNCEQNDTKSSLVEQELITSRLCLCTEKTKLFAEVGGEDIVFCNAIDSVEDKLIGCSRIADVRHTCLLRPSQRIPYQMLCDLHKHRLIRHNCCPTCGIFCTQGRFIECEAKHHYHHNCQLIVGTLICCPHCGTSSPSRNIHIELHGSKKPVILPVQKVKYTPARITFTPVKVQPKCETPPLLSAEILRDASQMDDDSQTFTENDLVDAIRDDDVKKMASIIASDCMDLHFKITDFNDGTLLHYSAYNGLLEICHLLVLANLEIDALDKEQNTPLMLAVSENKNEVVQYFIRNGASISLKGTDGMTSLHIAAKCGNLTATKMLLKASSTIPNFVNCQDDGGWTPLVWACEHGHLEVASYLIVSGADPFLRDVEHNEALHWASFSGSSAVVQLLLDEGADINTANAHGETPLHIAAREDRYNCIIVLLARGANASLLNKNGETPLNCVPEDGTSSSIISLNLRLQNITGPEYQKYKSILTNDISRGREANPIQCINNVDDEPEPKNYVYITKNIINSDVLRIDNKISSIRVCKCQDRCVSDSCECSSMSVKCWYDEEGKLGSDFNFTDVPMIFECNDLCSCNTITCRNRLVQRGLTQRFQIYKTESKGWGLKTLRFIPRGSFVCEYVGEILTGSEVDKRDDDSYVFDIYNSDTESFCVDAKHYGNLSRFINHSCTPNLYPIKVFTDHQDLRFPKIALFAVRNIAIEEELSFDYGKKFWLVKCKSFTCHCESPACKYSEEKIVEMLTTGDLT